MVVVPQVNLFEEIMNPQNNKAANDEFDAIRAYTDADLPYVLRRLKRDKALLNALASYRLARVYRFWPTMACVLMRCLLEIKLAGVKSIIDFQERITAYYFFHMINASVTGFEISGLEHIPSHGGALILSNHRDIILDPAFVDYVLHSKMGTTALLAAGDNLTQIPFAADLMRLNKSFWVKRGEKSPRKLLANLKTLSRYIRHSIVNEGELVWLAQREGRAKNGLDYTEEAVLKMLHLAERKLSWEATCEQLRFVPLTIAYEYDPCDLAKATELVHWARSGEQHKDDTASVLTSIVAPKGRVAICFSAPISPPGIQSSAQLVEVLDLAIMGNYRLFPSNLTALALLVDEGNFDTQAEQIAQTSFEDLCAARLWLGATASDEVFKQRARAVTDPLVRQVLLAMYANPCVSRWRLRDSAPQDQTNAGAQLSDQAG